MVKNDDNEPYEPRASSSNLGKNHLLDVLKCGAKLRCRDEYCKSPAMQNGRCRLHGGKSTGPRTPEGLARSKQANWKHGWFSAEAKLERRDIALTLAVHLLPEKAFSQSIEEIEACHVALREKVGFL